MRCCSACSYCRLLSIAESRSASIYPCLRHQYLQSRNELSNSPMSINRLRREVVEYEQIGLPTKHDFFAKVYLFRLLCFSSISIASDVRVIFYHTEVYRCNVAVINVHLISFYVIFILFLQVLFDVIDSKFMYPAAYNS